ncbi:T9SS type A sorting domain-containing protein [Natronoflexus pectinivorans]|uniref:Putative secreted protein (Por secretion system target) n=1 Tax=Natronoflexus pectinivorans TaxID=682526 RepID=A0A4R2GKM3_9BACT|nr:T9SS type A sorting domain-containing protein [Natronoflexus pectinivorans]TCO09229.1 putative secreted protein (Por secretion system target) [Natronoflexus pectinivorans]
MQKNLLCFLFKISILLITTNGVTDNLFAHQNGITSFSLPAEEQGQSIISQQQLFSSIHNTPFSLTDSILIFNNYTSSDSLKYKKTSYKYNLNNNVLEIVFQKAGEDDSNWYDYKSYIYTFDELKRQTQFLKREFDLNNLQWENREKREYKYVGNGRHPSEIADYTQSSGSETWKGNWKINHQYDSHGNVTKTEQFKWDSNINQWFITTRKDIIYNNTNQIVSKTSYYNNLTEEVWIGNNRTIYIYNDKSQLESELLMFWDAVESKWISSLKKEFYYTGEGMQSGWEALRWDRDFDIWTNWWKVENEYDAKGNLIGLFNYNWNQNLDQWVDGWQITNHFDPENNEQEETGFIWNSEKEDWVGIYRLFHQYNYEYSVKTISDFSWDHESEQWVLNQKRFHYLSVPEMLPLTLNIINQNGQIINNATVSIDGHLYEPGIYHFPAKAQGQYSITVNAVGYESASIDHNLDAFNTIVDIVLKDLSLNLPELHISDLHVYPNPAYNAVHIRMPEEITINQLSLYSSSGQLIHSDKPAHSAVRISVSDLPSGLYLLHAETSAGFRVAKIIVGHR